MVLQEPAYAEMTLKKLIIRDCPKAKIELTKLANTERPDLIRFLALVLKRRPLTPDRTPYNPSAPVMTNNPFESPLDESASGELFQFLDPSHESDAKICALESLVTLIPEAFQAIPAMLEISSDISVPSFVRSQTASSIIRITSESLKVPGFIPSADVIKDAIEGLSTSHRKLSENFLIELGTVALPQLFDEFKRPDVGRRNRVQQLLHQIDRSGQTIGPTIVLLLTSADVDIRIRAINTLGKLSGFAQSAIPKLIEALHDISLDVQNSALTSLTSLAPTYTQSEAKTKQIFSEAIEMIKNRAEGTRDEPQRFITMLYGSYPGAEREVGALLASKDEELQLRMLTILDDKAASLSDEVVQSILALLPKASERITIRALSVLSKAKNAPKASEAIVKLIQVINKGSVSLGREKITLESLRTLARLPSTDEGAKKLLPLAMTLIPQNADIDDTFLSTSSTALFIKKYGQAATPYLLKILDQNGEQTIGALTLLSSIAPTNKQVAAAALNLLKSYNTRVRTSAEAALFKAGKGVIDPLEKLLKNKSPSVKFSAAKVLSMLGSKDPLILPALLEGLPTKGCTDIGDIAVQVAQLQHGVSNQLFAKVLGCVQSGGITVDNFGAMTAKLAPLNDESKLSLLDLLRNTSTDKFLRLKVIELAHPLQLPPTEVAAILTDLSSNGDSALALVSLDGLKALGSQALLAAPKLMSIANDTNLEPVVRNEAALVASYIAPDSDGYVDFFVSELKSDQYDWGLKTIARLEPIQMKKTLDKAYDLISGENRRHVIRLISKLPRESAATFVPRLLQMLSSSKVPETRYEILTTLLKINPMIPELVQPLKEVLIDTSREDLIAEKFSPDIQPLLDSLLPQATSRLEQLGLEQMKANATKG